MDKPIYLQIKNKIQVEIQSKESNEVIESERALSKRLNVSRMTVRKALDELVEEGYIYREKNRGTFVSNRSLWKKNTIDPTEDVENVEYRLINFDVKYTVKDDILQKLELNPREPVSVIRAIRVAYKDKEPEKVEEFFILRRYIDEKNINQFDQLLDLNKYLEEGSMTQTFIPMIVPTQYAATLKLHIDVPIIQIEGVIRNKSGIPYIYYRSYNNPSTRKIEITL